MRRTFLGLAICCFLVPCTVRQGLCAEGDPARSRRQVEGFDREAGRTIAHDTISEIACYLYPHFMIKEYNVEDGGHRLAVVPLQDKKIECRRASEPNERRFGSGSVFPVNGYFVGVHGNFIFLRESPDAIFEARRFYVYDFEKRQRVFDDLSTSPIENIEASGSTLSMRYKKLHFANCSLIANEGACWEKIKNDTGLDDNQKPHCSYWQDFEKRAYESRRKAGYTEQEIKTELDNWRQADRSVIEYPVKASGSDNKFSVKVMPGEVACVPNFPDEEPVKPREVVSNPDWFRLSEKGFDAPLSKKGVIVSNPCVAAGSTDYDRKTHKVVDGTCLADRFAADQRTACVYYPHFLVKQYPEIDAMDAEASITPLPDGKIVECTENKQPEEVSVSGNFLGARGNFVFIEEESTKIDPLDIYDGITGKELFAEKSFLTLNNVELSASGLTIDYRRAYLADCPMLKDVGSRCWLKIKKETDLSDDQKPDCRKTLEIDINGYRNELENFEQNLSRETREKRVKNFQKDLYGNDRNWQIEYNARLRLNEANHSITSLPGKAVCYPGS
jgi:hypothetical protein